MYKIKLFFKRIVWYFETISYAKKHAKEVDNYKFLVSLRANAHEKYLIMDREDHENPDTNKLKIQIELLDKIINYVNR